MAGEERTFTTVSHWGAYRVGVRDGRVVGAEPFEKDTNPSPLIETMPGAIHDKTRIDRPMVRRGFFEDGAASDRSKRGEEPFVAVSWDQALGLVASELERVANKHGNEAIYGSSGWGSAGVFHQASTQMKRFLNGFGGFVDQVTNYSFGAASVILPHIAGGMEPLIAPTTWPSIVANTRLMVAFGGMSAKNAQVAKDGLGIHALGDWQRKAKAAGTEFVCIGPRRDDMPEFLDAEWLAARPNTDTAIMMGLAHTLVAGGFEDREFLARYCVGYETFRAYLMGEADDEKKDADWAARISEIDAETIRGLARRMAAARTMISVSWSVQRADHGEQPYWMAMVLAAILGQIGLPGGGVGYGYGAHGSTGNPRPKRPIPSLSLGRNRVEAFIPVARVSDMLLNPGGTLDFNGQRITYPDIRLIYWCGGNPFHKQQDINRLLRAWQKPETIIIHEPWWTPAARRADIVLPVTTTFERNDIGAASSDRFFIAMQKAIEPLGEARNEYDIFSDLARRLGFGESFTEGRDEMEWLGHIYDVARQGASRQGFELPSFERFWEEGHFEFPAPAEPPILFEAFREDPGANPLNTPSGKIEIFSEKIAGFGYDDCPGHPTWLEPAEWLGSSAAERHPLHMISNQPRHRMHSQMDCGAVSRAAKIADREPIWINPADAKARGIGEGDIVRVHNARGACLAGAIVTDSIRAGVVQLATGAWYDPLNPGNPGDSGIPNPVEALDKHGNPNVLTRDKGASKLTQTCTAQTVLVEIERYDAPAPAITAFDLPAIEPGD